MTEWNGDSVRIEDQHSASHIQHLQSSWLGVSVFPGQGRQKLHPSSNVPPPASLSEGEFHAPPTPDFESGLQS